MLFARLASNIGLEAVIGPAGRRTRLPDGSERFVVDEAILVEWTRRLGGPAARSNQDDRWCSSSAA
jgi:uncharacterized protein (DUF2235 family)